MTRPLVTQEVTEMSQLASFVHRLRARVESIRSAPDAQLRVWMRRRWLLVSVGVLVTAGFGVFDAWLLSCGFEGCPTPAQISAFRPAEGARVLDRNGKLIGRLNVVRRVNVSLQRVPVHVRQAFIATEDRRFYRHGGIDLRGFARASVRNARTFSVREGFSTISMQLARNTFLANRSQGDRSFSRKLLELRVARLIEHTLTKDQILEHYLNAIYLGNGVFGIEAASRDLFGKHVSELSVAEGAMLAALPKGPSAYTPRKDFDRALARRNLVLRLMRSEGYLSDDALSESTGEELSLASDGWHPAAPNESFAMDAVRTLVDSVLTTMGRRGEDVTILTTIDLTAQRSAERAVRMRAAAIEDEALGGWSEDGAESDAPGGRLEGAMVALDPRTGDIRSLVGGRSYQRGGFNRAIAARRQPGSAFKPFVYAAALSTGFTPASLVDDEPIDVPNGGVLWSPANFGGEYEGRVTLRRALMHSANAATVRVSRAVGERRVADVARRNGINSPFAIVPSIALGAVEVTPMELVAAYAPFANGGFRVQPRLVRRIDAADGATLWASTVHRESVMDARDAWQLTSMLRSVVDHGTGHAIREAGVRGPVAGKTGTTNNGADVWFVGYTPTLVAGFWFGYDVPRSLGDAASGGRLAAPAWAQFYQEGWRERGGEKAWVPPAGLVMREVDSETGELAGEWCPNRQREWFKPGTEPTEPCREHDGPSAEEWIAALPQQVPARARMLLRRLLRM